MRIAVIGAGVAGLVAAHRLARGGPRVRRLRALARARRPGGDARRRRRRAARALLPPPVHQRPPHRRPLRGARAAGRDRVAPSSVAIFAERRAATRSRPRSTCCASAAVACRRGCGWGCAVVALQRRHKRRASRSRAMTAPTGSCAHGPAGVGARLGPAAARQVRRPRRRHLDGLAVEQAHRCAARSRASEARQELLGYPRGSFSRCSSGCASSIEARGGRVLIDRPAARLDAATARLRVDAGSAGLVPRAATTRASFEPAGEPERYDAVLATVPSDVFEQLLDPRSPTEVGRRSTSPAARRSSTTPRSACCSSSTASSRRFYWTNIADRRAPVRRPDRAHEPRRARALRRAPLPLRGQLPRAGDDRCSTLDPDAAARRYEPGLRQVNPGFRATGSSSAGCFREPAAQPIVTVGYRDRCRRCAPRRARPGPGEHDADLSRGPRDELRGAAGR